MFRAMIPPIFRSTRLCVTPCGIMHPRCCRLVSWKRSSSASRLHYTTRCNTQSTAPEHGRDQRPKHVELIGIINKPLLLHLIGCIYYLQLITIEHNIIKYSHSYNFRPSGAIIRLAFGTY